MRKADKEYDNGQMGTFLRGHPTTDRYSFDTQTKIWSWAPVRGSKPSRTERLSDWQTVICNMPSSLTLKYSYP